MLTICIGSFANGQSLSYLGTATEPAGLTTYTFSSQSLGTAAADRYIVVGAATRQTGGLTLSSVTVGGVSATIVVQQNNGDGTTGLAIAAVPSGTTGDIVVTWSGASARCAIVFYRLTGLDSATPTDTDSDTATDPSFTLTKAAGPTIGITSVSSGSLSCSWTNLTENADSEIESMDYSSASEESTAGDSTITASWGGGTAKSMCAATWAYSSASATPLIIRRRLGN